MSISPKSNLSELPEDFDSLEDIARQDMQFIAYLEDDMTPQERNEFRAELLRDPELRREFDAFSEIMGATQSLPAEPLPADFLTKVQARIRAESGGRFFNPQAPRRSFIPYEAVSAAMILLMAAAWIALGTPRDHHIKHVDVTTPPQLHTSPATHRN
ncbi:anti-sigma factor family protein [Bradymonas sediminis]|uniref:Uncharacterized protein n=1 Tax=Bradymonas sediminis TaxID=1548548 RepID=A0A2Z4FG58_9DELT|nr:hypothetical protein [Bradymonas sediminis]AWV87911.1 hypothetical protein DN745_00635 [Bradymonas sediminis]TDP62928.1 hypothetical protein DFR33_11161 [Bradymonas sediminis]